MIDITKVSSGSEPTYRVWVDMKVDPKTGEPKEFVNKKDAISHAYRLTQRHNTQIRYY